jgi:hypothetical protein
MELENFIKIRNYNSNVEGIRLIKKEIYNFLHEYDYEINLEFLDIAYEYLTLPNKKELETSEYLFLCWLNYRFGKKIHLNIPHIVDPIEISLDLFKPKFLFSEKRNYLFEVLLEFICQLRTAGNICMFQIIIGGSFTDTDTKEPGDMDLVILLPLEQFNDINFNELNLERSKKVPLGIDFKFLPENYNLQNYRAYSNIIYLGNKAKYQAKSNCFYEQNNFEKRLVVKIKI